MCAGDSEYTDIDVARWEKPIFSATRKAHCVECQMLGTTPALFKMSVHASVGPGADPVL